MRNVFFVQTSWAAGNVSLYGVGLVFPELLALCSQCVVHDEGYVCKFAAETIEASHGWRVEMLVPWKWRMTRRSETRETSPVIETERLWRVPRQVEKELRNQCPCTLRQEITSGHGDAKCLLLPFLKCVLDTHSGRTSCCTKVLFYLPPSSFVWVRSNEPETANREEQEDACRERQHQDGSRQRDSAEALANSGQTKG